MAVDRGNRGASSRYYGTGQSETRRRQSADDRALQTAFQEGRADGYARGLTSAESYNAGLDHRAQQLRNASWRRGAAVKKVREQEAL